MFCFIGRGLNVAAGFLGTSSFLIATSHMESPAFPDVFAPHRERQAQEVRLEKGVVLHMYACRVLLTACTHHS